MLRANILKTLTLNFNKSKTNWDGAEESKITNFYKIDS